MAAESDIEMVVIDGVRYRPEDAPGHKSVAAPKNKARKVAAVVVEDDDVKAVDAEVKNK